MFAVLKKTTQVPHLSFESSILKELMPDFFSFYWLKGKHLKLKPKIKALGSSKSCEL